MADGAADTTTSLLSRDPLILSTVNEFAIASAAFAWDAMTLV
jgi:hypothetical protein